MNSGDNRPNVSGIPASPEANDNIQKNDTSGTVVFNTVNNYIDRQSQDSSASGAGGNNNTVTNNGAYPKIGNAGGFDAPMQSEADVRIYGHTVGSVPGNVQNTPVNNAPFTNQNTFGDSPAARRPDNISGNNRDMINRAPTGVQNDNPNTSRVMPKAQQQNATPGYSQNATRVMPRVQQQNGTPGYNPNATRVMPKVQQQNGTPGYNPNATRVMPRVQQQNAANRQNINGHGNNVIPQNVPSGRIPRNVQPGINGSPNVLNTNSGIMRNNSQNKAMSAAGDHTSEKNPPNGNIMKKKRKTKRRFGFLVGASKFILYIAFVVIASILIAKYAIGAGNDVFAFVKDSYNYTDTVYSTKGEATNTLRITETNLSGDKFEFEYAFGSPLTNEEKQALDATILVVDTKNNSTVHNFGKYTQDVLEGNKISVDLSNADMEDSEYILRFSVGTGNSVFYITEFSLSRKLVDITLDEDASTSDVAKVLKEKGVIDYPSAFKMYAKLKKGDKKSLGSTYVPGDHVLYAGMDYDEILYALSPKIYVRDIVKLTFPEGSTVDEIIDILIKGGVRNSKADYIRVMENYTQFDYRFIDMLEQQGFDDGRVYSLEGYLFPDTYEFYTDSSPEAVIDKFLANFDVKFDNSFYDEAAKLGLTVDEVVRIASLVESEAGNPDDKGNIASVFHNRLNNASVYPRLESDATTDYASYNLRSSLKLTDYKCEKCGKKESKKISKCSECGNSNSYNDYKCASFSIKLDNYGLTDADYYISFSVSTDTTRTTSRIGINKKTVDGKAVYSITNKNTSSNPEFGNLGMTITEAKVDSKGILTCEVMLDHGFDENTFAKFPIRLNLFRSEYDTYNTNGLMPGAVSNPGYESIIAALYPNSTNYYFFVADSSGDSHFASTLDQHNQNIATLVRDGKAVSSD